MPSLLRDQDYFQALEQAASPKTAEGQLHVDVIETNRDVIVRTAVAGVKGDDIDVGVTEDTVTIRGERREPDCTWGQQGIVHVQECHWGAFSRSVILPCRVRPEEADAVLKDGVLTITLGKQQHSGRLTIIDDSEL